MIIYKATNQNNGKAYIGKTVRSLRQRIAEHTRSKTVTGFQGALKKYGIDAFKWEVIETCSCEDQLAEREIHYIELYRTFVGFDDCNGYNLTLGGDGAVCGSKNVSHRQDVKDKISNALKGRPLDSAHKIAISETLSGRILSNEHTRHISEGMIGRDAPKGSASKLSKCYVVTHPDGSIEEVIGLREFCRKHNLHPNLLRKTAIGKHKQHKGFTCKPK